MDGRLSKIQTYVRYVMTWTFFIESVQRSELWEVSLTQNLEPSLVWRWKIMISTTMGALRAWKWQMEVDVTDSSYFRLICQLEVAVRSIFNGKSNRKWPAAKRQQGADRNKNDLIGQLGHATNAYFSTWLKAQIRISQICLLVYFFGALFTLYYPNAAQWISLACLGPTVLVTQDHWGSKLH